MKLGILLPISEMSNYYYAIIDESGKLWYAERDIIRNIDDIKAFIPVFFRYGDNEKVSYIYCFNWHLIQNERVNVHFFAAMPWDGFGCASVHDAYDVQFEFDEIEDWNYRNPERDFCITMLNYYRTNNNIFKETRYFISDPNYGFYHELSTAFVKEIINNTGFDTHLPYSQKEINHICEIYKKVSEFNPYEVFESYRIEITYEEISRVGRDNYYFEYKEYSFNYLDNYLARWFKNERIKLHEDSGYTSHFERENKYQRFYDEEEKAKKEAYRNYNRQAHFDYLMDSYYSEISDRFLRIKSDKMNYSPSIVFSDELHIKEIYACINSHLQDLPKKLRTESKDLKALYEKTITKAVKSYNDSLL